MVTCFMWCTLNSLLHIFLNLISEGKKGERTWPVPWQVGQSSSSFDAHSWPHPLAGNCIRPDFVIGRMVCLARSFFISSFIYSKSFCLLALLHLSKVSIMPVSQTGFSFNPFGGEVYIWRYLPAFRSCVSGCHCSILRVASVCSH